MFFFWDCIHKALWIWWLFLDVPKNHELRTVALPNCSSPLFRLLPCRATSSELHFHRSLKPRSFQQQQIRSCIWRPCMKSSAVVRNNSSQIKISFDHLEFDPVFWRSPREKFQVSGTVYSLTVCTIILMETSWFPPPSVSCQRIATLRRRIAARIRRLPWQMLGSRNGRRFCEV